MCNFYSRSHKPSLLFSIFKIHVRNMILGNKFNYRYVYNGRIYLVRFWDVKLDLKAFRLIAFVCFFFFLLRVPNPSKKKCCHSFEKHFFLYLCLRAFAKIFFIRQLLQKQLYVCSILVQWFSHFIWIFTNYLPVAAFAMVAAFNMDIIAKR